ncbi:MAG: DUF4351 domain-containing protein [Magnetococcales bacterium]|nr:DUF4351 domain-containing protein [Magnetococcales bacterium]
MNRWWMQCRRKNSFLCRSLSIDWCKNVEIASRKAKRDGIQIGEAKILPRLLQRRFGTVPEWANERIAKADLSSLEEWSLRIFDAQSLDDVFSDKV